MWMSVTNDYICWPQDGHLAAQKLSPFIPRDHSGNRLTQLHLKTTAAATATASTTTVSFDVFNHSSFWSFVWVRPCPFGVTGAAQFAGRDVHGCG